MNKHVCPECGNDKLYLSDEDEQGMWAECQDCKNWFKLY